MYKQIQENTIVMVRYSI